ncbi:MAG: hypothetical protein H6655_22385 [Ardenticatenaceae bacterium]|nr:hypothetical protein [Ardenticatenaceae bacterium]
MVLIFDGLWANGRFQQPAPTIAPTLTQPTSTLPAPPTPIPATNTPAAATATAVPTEIPPAPRRSPCSPWPCQKLAVRRQRGVGSGNHQPHLANRAATEPADAQLVENGAGQLVWQEPIVLAVPFVTEWEDIPQADAEAILANGMRWPWCCPGRNSPQTGNLCA